MTAKIEKRWNHSRMKIKIAIVKTGIRKDQVMANIEDILQLLRIRIVNTSCFYDTTRNQQ